MRRDAGGMRVSARSLARAALALVMAAVLAACGGGSGTDLSGNTPSFPGAGSGSGGTGGTGTTANAGAIVVAVYALSGSNLPTNSITAGTPAVARATVTNGSGQPVSNALVSFAEATNAPGVVFSPATALTDSNGVASVNIGAAAPTTSGAFAVKAAVTLGGVALASTFNVAITPTKVAQGSVVLTVVDGSGQPKNDLAFGLARTAKAVVKDSAGQPVANVVVRFQSSDAAAIAFSPAATALTNGNGEASVTVGPAAASTAGAYTLTASAQVGGDVVQGSYNVSVTATQAPSSSLSLSITDSGGLPTTIIKSGTLVRAIAVVRNSSGQAISNALVRFEEVGGAGALRFSPAATALTDASGTATVNVGPAGSATAGAFTINAVVTVNQVTVQDSKNVSVVPTLPTQGSIAVSLLNGTTGLPQVSLDYGSTYTVKAVVRNGTGQVVPNTIVTFGGVLPTEVPGNVTPPPLNAPIRFVPARNVLTDATGVATVSVTPDSAVFSGTSAGAFALTAQASVDQQLLQSQTNIYVNPPPTQPCVNTLALSVVDVTSGQPTNAISYTTRTVAKAVVKDTSCQPVANALVTFGASGGVAFSPATTALTGPDGVASVVVAPATILTAGAYAINATSQVGGQSVSGAVNVAIGATQVGLGTLSFGNATLSAYGTTVVSVPVTGVPATTPIQVRFSSVCAAQNPAKATVTSLVTSSGGVARATYTDQGCGGSDLVTATVEGTSTTSSANLNIAVPGTSNLQFLGASPSAIVIRGTGGVGLSEVAVARFRLVDQSNRPVTIPTSVSLELSNRTGGLTIDGGAGPVVKQTDANGEVSVSIQSGTLPTPYWVLATVNVGGVARTTSSTLLTVSTGRPTQARFSLSADYYNLEGLRYDSGETGTCGTVICAKVLVIAADTFGNPVPDGTVVNFISEGGTFDRPSCQTVAGTCSVVFRSANSRPDGGRVTIVAYAVGEEDYDDVNGNNRYDAGEPFRELGWLYLDSNENLQRDALEAEIPFVVPLPSSGGVACVNSGVPTLGVPSKPGTCDGVWGSAHVRRAAVFTFSDSFGVFKRSPGPPFGGFSDLASTTYPFGRLGDACVATVPFWIQDRNGNPMPYGTALTVEAIGASGAAAKVESATVGSTTNPGGTFHVATVTVPYDATNQVCPPAYVTIRATTQQNNVSSVTVPVGQ